MTRSSLIPGFRFHPTDVELVMYYLKRKLLQKKIIINAVAEVNIYDFCPWDLPDKSSLRSGDLEWFFFCPKARKYSSGSRSNRATETGFWKATGKERLVKYKERGVAMIKTLVFHLGNAPNGKRTDWVMHEYCMKDEHLANAGIVQDSYVLCKIFQKSGAGPKNGAQYGAPFNEEEWDDDVASCSESQVVIGSYGNTNTLTHKQTVPATMNTTVPQSTHSLCLTEPGSSTVTFCANETTNTLNHKQKGPATMNTTVPQSTRSLCLTEPGSSTVTFSVNETTNTLNHKQKGPATMNTTVPQSTRSLCLTEPGSSTVTFSVNKTTNTLNHKQKGPATMNITVPQSTHSLCLTEPGPSTVMFSANERCANDDVLFYEDIALIMGASSTDDDGLFSENFAAIMGVSTEDVNGDNKKEGVEKGKGVAANEETGIYDNLDDLFNLDDLNGPAFDEYTLDTAFTADDLKDFYVD